MKIYVLEETRIWNKRYQVKDLLCEAHGQNLFEDGEETEVLLRVLDQGLMK